jgi:hypothetical protein
VNFLFDGRLYKRSMNVNSVRKWIRVVILLERGCTKRDHEFYEKVSGGTRNGCINLH